MRTYLRKKIIKIISFYNFKNSCLDIKFLNKKKNYFDSSFNFIYVFLYLLSFNINIKISKKKLQRGILFTLDHQNKNGSYDEWYKNENSFCSTAYTANCLSRLLIKQKNLDNSFLKKLLAVLSKARNFLFFKFSNTNLNQSLAKLAFFINFKKKINKSEFIKIKKIIHENKSFEYGGIDLGYLSVNIMLLASILVKIPNKSILNCFIQQIQLFKSLTLNFNYFPNYIFSRSSRLLMISGFLYAFKNNIISKHEFKKIFYKYDSILNDFIKTKNLKYLSFFYFTDFENIFTNSDNRIYSIKKTKVKFYKDFILIRFSKKKFFAIYKKNPNVFVKLDKIEKYYFDRSILYKNSLLTSNTNISIFQGHNFIFFRNNFSRTFFKKDILKYSKYVSVINKYIKVGKFFKYFGQKFFIIRKIFKNIRSYKKIFYVDNKVFVDEKIIYARNFSNIFKISQINEQPYFSPTSFIKKKEIGKVKKIKSFTIKKLGFNVYCRKYECI